MKLPDAYPRVNDKDPTLLRAAGRAPLLPPRQILSAAGRMFEVRDRMQFYLCGHRGGGASSRIVRAGCTHPIHDA